MKFALIDIWGGFHNAGVITLHIRQEDVPTRHHETAAWITESGVLSDGQRTRLMKHMCGHKNCMCSLLHGSKWSVRLPRS